MRLSGILCFYGFITRLSRLFLSLSAQGGTSAGSRRALHGYIYIHAQKLKGKIAIGTRKLLAFQRFAYYIEFKCREDTFKLNRVAGD